MWKSFITWMKTDEFLNIYYGSLSGLHQSNVLMNFALANNLFSQGSYPHAYSVFNESYFSAAQNGLMG